MSPVESFRDRLRWLGYTPELRSGDFVVFDYEVSVGGHAGQKVQLGFQVPPDWPLNPPTGPYVSPRLLPINTSTGQGRPWDSVHEAHPRGLHDSEGLWEYWSRPYPADPGWGATDRSVDIYLRHIRTLFGELP